MTTEFLGENAVRELFDIIAENYVSQEEFETREKSLASATSVGTALIAVALLKVAEAIKTAMGGEGGVEVDDEKIATDSEVEEVLSQYFNNSGSSATHTSGGTSSVEDGEVATDEEVGDVLDNYFN